MAKEAESTCGGRFNQAEKGDENSEFMSSASGTTLFPEAVKAVKAVSGWLRGSGMLRRRHIRVGRVGEEIIEQKV
jgi:hypothetical protein